jgi:glycosyltransferase involved in cell wall biosynthesis
MIRLLFSGTISESTGVFEAIHLANVLHQQDQTVRLIIIGYCSLDSTLKAVRLAIQDKPFISLTGGDQLVPHQEIMHQIFNSDFGIIYYPPSPHTENRIPTKLYEYMSAELPLLLQNYPPWVILCDPWQAVIPIDFHAPIDAYALLKKMKQSSFYPIPPTDVDWSSEEKKLLESVSKILV